MQHSKTPQSDVHVFCHHAVMEAWLGRLLRKQMSSTHAGSNPADFEHNFLLLKKSHNTRLINIKYTIRIIS